MLAQSQISNGCSASTPKYDDLAIGLVPFHGPVRMEDVIDLETRLGVTSPVVTNFRSDEVSALAADFRATVLAVAAEMR